MNIILDTETTGLGEDARICEIGILNADTGEVILNTLINPLCKIPAGASKIHGITDEMVSGAPTFDSVAMFVFELMTNGKTIIYNADYDLSLISQSTTIDYRLELFANAHCLMLEYAEAYGEPNTRSYGDHYRWQKLTEACKQQGIDTSGIKAHRAIADCHMTRALYQRMQAGSITTYSDRQ